MRETKPKSPSHSLGWASIMTPLFALVAGVIAVRSCVEASDTEPIGHMLGLLLGLVVAGVIVLVAAILGLVFASRSQNHESCPRLSSAGIALNSIMIAIAFLIPVAPTVFPGLLRALNRWLFR